jgi:hypothetical protein
MHSEALAVLARTIAALDHRLKDPAHLLRHFRRPD